MIEPKADPGGVLVTVEDGVVTVATATGSVTLTVANARELCASLGRRLRESGDV